MQFILDTDVFSNLSKQKPNETLLQWIAATPAEDLRIPLSAIFELFMGIEGLIKEKKNNKAEELEVWLDGLLRSYNDQIDNPDIAIARLQARMFAAPVLRNFLQQNPNSTKLKFGVDLIVAATAIVRGAAVVSFNVSDYESIHQYFPLPGLYHPGRDEWIIAYDPASSYSMA
jgi:predicted nucleic acid-binding protein